MRGHTERIGYGDAVPSEAFLKIFRKEKAASALGGGRENHSIPKTETVAGGKFGGAHDHGFRRLDQGEGVAPA